MTTTKALTVQDITRGENDDRWLGWGYLGERQRSGADQLLIAAADQRIIDFANDHGWTYEDLFSWLNSRNGRHFGDAIFGGVGRFDQRFEQAVRWGLLRKVED